MVKPHFYLNHPVHLLSSQHDPSAPTSFFIFLVMGCVTPSHFLFIFLAVGASLLAPFLDTSSQAL
jgi:arginine exporter protein ArgO